MIRLGKTAKMVRDHFGLTQKETARLLGISIVHLSNIENNLSSPSPSLLDRYMEVWNIDLYVLAWCLFGDTQRLPRTVRSAASTLGEAFQKQLAGILESEAGERKAKGAANSKSFPSREPPVHFRN